MSLMIILISFLFIYLLIYFYRKLFKLVIHFSFACDLYFKFRLKLHILDFFLILSYTFFYYYFNP